MSENHMNSNELLKLLLSFIPPGNEALKVRALLLATFDNLKDAIEAMATYIANADPDEDTSKERDFLEKMKNHLN